MLTRLMRLTMLSKPYPHHSWQVFFVGMVFVVMVGTLACHARAQPEPVIDVDVQALIDDAIRQHKTRVDLPPGRIMMGQRVIRIKGVKGNPGENTGETTGKNAGENVGGSVGGTGGLTISGPRTTLVFANHDRVALSIEASDRVTLKGFTMDFDPLPFTQGTVTAAADDRSWIEFQVHEGYPELAGKFLVTRAHVFEPNRVRLKATAPDVYASELKVISPTVGRLIFNHPHSSLMHIEPGDRLVLNQRGPVGIHVDTASNIRIEDVTIHAAPGAAVICRFMRGDNYFKYDVVPGPTPIGASQPRLMSTCADAFNYAYADQGPTLEDCEFTLQGDDSVNLHGVSLPVLARLSDQSFITARPYGSEPGYAYVLQSGAAIRFLSHKDFAVLERATLAAWTELQPDDPFITDALSATWNSMRPEATRRNPLVTYYRIDLEEPVPFEPGMYLDIPGIACPGFVIRGNHFHDHRARGLRIMAVDGLIENNIIERVKSAGITLGPEYTFWHEAGWVESITVRHNVIRDTGQGALLTGDNENSDVPIAIYYRHPEHEKATTFPPSNQNISIENNEIHALELPMVSVRAAHAVIVRDNTFKLDGNIHGSADVDTGPSTEADANQLGVEALHVSDVHVSGNHW